MNLPQTHQERADEWCGLYKSLDRCCEHRFPQADISSTTVFQRASVLSAGFREDGWHRELYDPMQTSRNNLCRVPPPRLPRLKRGLAIHPPARLSRESPSASLVPLRVIRVPPVWIFSPGKAQRLVPEAYPASSQFQTPGAPGLASETWESTTLPPPRTNQPRITDHRLCAQFPPSGAQWNHCSGGSKARASGQGTGPSGGQFSGPHPPPPSYLLLIFAKKRNKTIFIK